MAGREGREVRGRKPQRARTTESRLTELEIKYCQQDDLLEELSRALYRQQEQLDRLERRLAEIETQPAATALDRGGAADERPPHY